MRSTTVFQFLIALSFWSSCEAYAHIDLHVNDGSEVRAQKVFDELTAATLVKNKTAMADCLHYLFYWEGKGKGLKKDEFIDYLLRISKRTTPTGIINSGYMESEGRILTYADINFIGKSQKVFYLPNIDERVKSENGWVPKPGFRDTIRSIYQISEETPYHKLNETDKITVDFLRSLYRGMSFQNETEVLRHLTEDLTVKGCRGSYDRDWIANMYSSFRKQRWLQTILIETELVENGKEIRGKIDVREPWHMADIKREPYFIHFNLVPENGMYKMKLAEYKADCDWPGL